jgi:transcriptional regulator with PAS, ATPase and Fis domain
VQAKLLRAIQEREYVSLGSTRPIKVDFRVVAATQKPLSECVAAGSFRTDLFARLNGHTVRIPPLRDRREDIPSLFRHFLRSFAPSAPPSLSPRLVEALCCHDWPSNVRELEHTAKRLSVLAQHQRGIETFTREHLPDELRIGPRASQARNARSSPRQSQHVAALAEALARNHGNVARAARELGISRSRANRIIEANSIDAGRYRAAPAVEEM